MKIDESTINIGYVQIERHVCVPKTKLIITGSSSLTNYEIGKLCIGEHKDKFVLYPAHVGMKVDTTTSSFLLIPKHEIVAFVEPEDNEEFMPYVQYKHYQEGSEWIGKK